MSEETGGKMNINDAKEERVVDEGKWDGNGYYAPQICEFCHECKKNGKRAPKCCEAMPCVYSPNDFIVLRKGSTYTREQKLMAMIELIKQGRISIDMSWFKDPYYGPLNVMTKRPDFDKIIDGDGYLLLRARAKDRPVVDFQFFMKKGIDYPCVNWDPEKGCVLTGPRPAVGRFLKPVLKEKDGQKYCACEQMGFDEVMLEWSDPELAMFMYDLYLAVRDLNI